MYLSFRISLIRDRRSPRQGYTAFVACKHRVDPLPVDSIFVDPIFVDPSVQTPFIREPLIR